MQRQLGIKLLSKFSQNCSSSSSLLKAANPFHHSSFSHHSTPLWRAQFCNEYTVTGALGKIGKGFCTSPLLGRRFLSNALVKGQIKCANSSTVWVLTRRNFHSFDSRFSQSGGWRSIVRRITPDGVVSGLVLANVAVFMLWKIADRDFMVKNFMISVDNFTSGRLHTMITSAFSHKDPWHLISNMFGLYFFGSSVGRLFGTEYMLKLYFSGAIVGSIFYLAYNTIIARSFEGHMYGLDPKKIPGLGASGAVNAIMLLSIFLSPTSTIFVDLIIPVPAFMFGAFIIGRDIMRMVEGDSNISGSAHLGGATVAAIAWMQLRRGRFRRF